MPVRMLPYSHDPGAARMRELAGVRFGPPKRKDSKGAVPALIARVQDVVANTYRVHPHALSSGREHRLSGPRHIAVYLSYELGNYTLEEVGAAFNGLHHTSVRYARQMVKRGMERDTRYAAQIANLEGTILARIESVPLVEFSTKSRIEAMEERIARLEAVIAKMREVVNG